MSLTFMLISINVQNKKHKLSKSNTSRIAIEFVPRHFVRQVPVTPQKRSLKGYNAMGVTHQNYLWPTYSPVSQQ